MIKHVTAGLILALTTACFPPFVPPGESEEINILRHRIENLEAEKYAMEEELRLAQNQSESFRARLEDEQNRRQRELDSLRQQLANIDQVEIIERGGQPVVRLESALLFPSGRHTLTKEGKKAVEQVAAALKKAPLNDRHISIEGHTDADKIVHSKDRYQDNWDLASQRAYSVLKALEKAGVRTGRLRGVYYGSTRPVTGVPGKNKSEKARDRRVEIIVLG